MVEVSQSQLAHAVGKINRIPDRYRVFQETAELARALYRIDADTLARSLDLGLPCRGQGADMRFDALDLRNLALSLRLNAPWFVAMRWWASALQRGRTDVTRAYHIRIHSRCQGCGNGNCTFNTSPEVIAAADAVDDCPPAPADMSVTTRLTGPPVPLPADVADLMHIADPVEWHLIPNALTADVGFIRETGLADCRLMALHLNQEARRRGMPVRQAFGLIVTVPFSRVHTWVEFAVDGRWLPADPLWFNSMSRWGYLDPLDWPPTTSPLGTLWRISDLEVPLAMHQGRPVDWSLPTSQITK